MIRIEKLRFGYGGAEDVLRLEEFALDARTNALVVGPSGCGKTTLLHLIAGLLLPTGGRVLVDGQDLAAHTPRARDRFRGQHIGIVLQQFHLLPTLTALQNLLVAQSIAGLPVDRAAARTMLGGAAGLLLAHVLVAILRRWMLQQDSLRITAWVFSVEELWLLVPALVAAALAALLPSWRAAQANISATLARRS